MINPIDQLVEYPDLSKVEIEALRGAIVRDVALATLATCRREIGSAVHEAVGKDDRRLFTLCALYRAGRTDGLSTVELELVLDQANRFEKACANHPGIRLASEDVADAAAAFSELWDAHFDADDQSVTAEAKEDDPAPRMDAAGVDAESDVDAAPIDAETNVDASAVDLEMNVDVPRIGARTEPDGRPPHRRRAARKRTSDRPAAERFARRPSRIRGARSVYRWLVRGAITLAVLAFAVILTQLASRESGRITVETADGQTQLIELSDGSRVRVLESSTFSYMENDSPINRGAELHGRAYFEITPEGRGFLVETPTARVTVLGTSFGIEARERITEVVLTEGRLTLARSTQIDDFVVLAPGQMSRVVAGSSPSSPIEVDVPRRLVWTGLFIFQSTPLREIADLLGEHYGVSIDVGDDLASERVTGTFEQSRPLEEILRIVASAVGAQVASDSAGGYAITHP